MARRKWEPGGKPAGSGGAHVGHAHGSAGEWHDEVGFAGEFQTGRQSECKRGAGGGRCTEKPENGCEQRHWAQGLAPEKNGVGKDGGQRICCTRGEPGENCLGCPQSEKGMVGRVSPQDREAQQATKSRQLLPLLCTNSALNRKPGWRVACQLPCQADGDRSRRSTPASLLNAPAALCCRAFKPGP